MLRTHRSCACVQPVQRRPWRLPFALELVPTLLRLFVVLLLTPALSLRTTVACSRLPDADDARRRAPLLCPEARPPTGPTTYISLEYYCRSMLNQCTSRVDQLVINMRIYNPQLKVRVTLATNPPVEALD